MARETMKLSLVPLEVVNPIFAGIVTDGPDYVVLHDRWPIGRIRFDRGNGGGGYWWWGLTALHPLNLTTHGRGDTLEEAQASYKKAWLAWLDAGGDFEDTRHINSALTQFEPAAPDDR
ncbi:hypothetical protein [Terrihabitans rhizophilus]|uniref:Uncharacterized protein n=1 Tax=Terrihabitans rhizophilus TaxID=3092662 RepID=A0ABU4RQM2_9HYPH|nr:hypothetical protein [Terrihabitans sp. PJ23]MDX6807141.1 hypothetical protein [Terrihabitans sp. PJ23]